MRFFALFLLLSGSLAHAAPVTITFESVDLDGFPTTITDSGFEFYTPAGFLSSDGTPNPPPAGGTAAFYCPGCTTTMTAVGGDLFDLHSFEMAYLLGGPNPSFVLTGTYADGSTIATPVQVAQSWDQVTLGAGWTNLISVEFGDGADAVGLDNIVVNVIPIPAAAWLFASALCWLGFRRRTA